MATPKNQSVQKAFALLRSFQGPDEWLSNAELSRRAHLSKAAAHRLMKTLEEIGAVVRDTRGAYRPGLVLASLSRNIAIGDLVRLASEAALADLAAHLRGIVHLGVLENGMVTCVARTGTSTRVDVTSQAGARLKPYCSALGKALLSGLSDEQLDDYLREGEMVAMTPQTITDRHKLFSQIRDIRYNGYSIDDREAYQTICCVGAPIYDPGGKVIAALALADTSDNMSASWRDEVSSALRAAAAQISRKIYPSYAAQ